MVTRSPGSCHAIHSGYFSARTIRHSVKVGHIVAPRTNSAATRNSQLLTRNANSRLSTLSSSPRERSSGRRHSTSPKLNSTIASMKPPKVHASTGSAPKAWTLWTTPLRVMNVPTIVSKKLMITSDTFHTFIMPRRSWIMIECRNAVTVNQGKRPAFSTGSQAQ
jgi:hypothetical protein